MLKSSRDYLKANADITWPILICVLLLEVIYYVTIFGITDGLSKPWQSIIGEQYGILVDILVFAILFKWLDKLTFKIRENKRCLKELKDFSDKIGEEIGYRNVANLKTLMTNKYKPISNIDLCGIYLGDQWLLNDPLLLKCIIKRLKGANLLCAHFQGVNLQDANLNGANLQGANLRLARLNGANLRNADLRKACLYGANLKRANLQGANLQGADLENARLREANLQDSNFQNANLYNAHLQDTEFQDAIIKNACLKSSNLQGANLQDANLNGANLQGANLRNVYFGYAKLKRVDFWNANLQGAKKLTVLQLSLIKSLNRAKLDPELREQVKKKCPHLLKKPEENKNE